MCVCVQAGREWTANQSAEELGFKCESIRQHRQYRSLMVSYVCRLAESGEVSQGQLLKGLSRVADQLGDLCLDNPAAREQHGKVMEVCVHVCWCVWVCVRKCMCVWVCVCVRVYV